MGKRQDVVLAVAGAGRRGRGLCAAAEKSRDRLDEIVSPAFQDVAEAGRVPRRCASEGAPVR